MNISTLLGSAFLLSAVACAGAPNQSAARAPELAGAAPPALTAGPRTEAQAQVATPPARTPEPGPSMSEIQQAVSEIHPDLRQCYIAGTFKDSHLEGTVTVTFTIDPTGSVSSAIDGGSSLHDPDVVRCVLGEFASLRFDSGGGSPTEVTYSVPFRQQG